MSLRIVILSWCICSAMYAQAPAPEASREMVAEIPRESPAQAAEAPLNTSQSKRQLGQSLTSKLVTAVKPAAPAPPPSPVQKLLDALDAAIQQAAKSGSRNDIPALTKRLGELRANFNSNGDPAEISKQSTQLLATLYVPEVQKQPVPATDPPPQPGWRQTDYLLLALLVSLYLLLALVVSLMSPLICVVGFWWGSKMTENGLRKGLRDAGLL